MVFRAFIISSCAVSVDHPTCRYKTTAASRRRTRKVNQATDRVELLDVMYFCFRKGVEIECDGEFSVTVVVVAAVPLGEEGDVPAGPLDTGVVSA